MINVTIQQAASANWVGAIAPALSALSFFLAAIAFIRSSKTSEFQLYTKLSEQIDEKWCQLHTIKKAPAYKEQLIDILNHYERCATIINDFRIFRGRSMRALEQQILECLEKNWKERYVRDTFEEARSSDQTYKELNDLMKRSKKFCFC